MPDINRKEKEKKRRRRRRRRKRAIRPLTYLISTEKARSRSRGTK
jgi:hypothetical protein